ncbi:CoB--CoM heterodisulfide reductase subunit C [Methanothermobacter tenebrarum]|uniref:CoB--CoM heterodisulfide reductase subunit C n=1 Tax=Methanothermobacter tenebrarum TaxID=680118 RepID=A0A328PIX4_9EURY|nr:CoB--CoM heterodisulfide reductase subunit C [Methanothermobacter tenebrarum]NPV64209.1 CoB--CoM heterodisulfide reductase subunit C [Methanobacteriaceae archaeon]RAO79825.1 CoB--CoM heterodisulfide reductase subunit C [Methanothermobacter tenebrarum]
MSILERLKRLLIGEEKPEEKETEKPAKEEVKAKEEKETKEEVAKEEPEKPEEVKEEVAKEEPEKPEEVKEEEVSEETEEEKVEKEEKPERSDIMTLLKGEEELIRRSDVDMEFSEKVKAAGGESLEYCFQCGTCTGSCPSGRRTPYKVRQIIRKANMGLKDQLLSDPALWMCTTCYSCQERCPRKVKIVDVVKLIRNEAAKAGYMSPVHKAVGSFVIKTGHGVPIDDTTKQLRDAVGLGELPPTTHSFPEALEEVQKIIKTTGFDSLIGYNWETGEIE